MTQHPAPKRVQCCPRTPAHDKAMSPITTKRFYSKALDAEMDEHLGYKKKDNAGDNSGNSRNGYTKKTVITDDNDTIEVQVPRDRNSTFAPVIIPKHEKWTPLFNDQIISMYSFGMSTRDIQRHLQQVYGVEVSPETISNITASVMADVREWQNRPLEKSYPILFLDALRVNSRQDGKNINKALYVALAINWEGKLNPAMRHWKSSEKNGTTNTL